jgi:hypothetical protein
VIVSSLKSNLHKTINYVSVQSQNRAKEDIVVIDVVCCRYKIIFGHHVNRVALWGNSFQLKAEILLNIF